MELKKQSGEFFDKIVSNKMPHPSIANMKGRDGRDGREGDAELFSQKFNRNFEKCKVYDDETEFGYGKNMDESSKVREDIKIDKVIKKNKIDNKSFNDIFNSKVPINKQLVKYREPEPLLLAKSLQFTELGNKRPDDYSSSSIKKTNSLSYSDYMKAHEGTRLVDTSIIKDMKEFKSVEEYEVYRDTKAKVELSAKELKQQELKKLREEKEEQMRLERLNKYDRNIELSYEKANRLFIR
jgi:hypothetical protein